MNEKTTNLILKVIIIAIYTQVWLGTLGSLYFSRVMDLPPCSLCLIQRGLLYPLIIIIGIGLWKKDYWLPYYLLAFSLLGLIVAGYHNLLVWGWNPSDLAICTDKIPCALQELTLYGFITIPLMSFLAFLSIAIGSFVWLKLNPKSAI